jgi:hypothetical protein
MENGLDQAMFGYSKQQLWKGIFANLQLEPQSQIHVDHH